MPIQELRKTKQNKKNEQLMSLHKNWGRWRCFTNPFNRPAKPQSLILFGNWVFKDLIKAKWRDCGRAQQCDWRMRKWEAHRKGRCHKAQNKSHYRQRETWECLQLCLVPLVSYFPEQGLCQSSYMMCQYPPNSQGTDLIYVYSEIFHYVCQHWEIPS